MKLAVSNLTLPAFDHLAHLSRLKALGVDGLEIAPDHTWTRPHWGKGFAAAELRAYHRAVQAAELKVVGLHALLGGRPELGLFEDADTRHHTIEHLVHLSTVCRDLGGRTLILDGRWRRDLPVKEAWLQARELLERLLPRIESHGTVLCFAPLGPDEGDFCRLARECYMLVNALDHPSFGIHLSTAGLTGTGERGHANFAAARGRLEHFHIDEPGRVRLGSTGLVDHADMRRHLVASTYRGWVSLVQRFEPNWSPIDAVGEAVRFHNEFYLDPRTTGQRQMTEDERLRIIQDIITDLRPGVQADGGDLELVAVRGQRVEVKLSGKCLSCALAGQTLGGIRRKLMAVLDTPVMVVPLAA